MVVNSKIISYNLESDSVLNFKLKEKSMNNKLFEGSAVALVTPHRSDGKVNYAELERLINFQIENGTDAILVCGTTGEASTMSDRVQISVIKHSVNFVGGRVPLLAGTGSNDTKKAVKLSYLAQEAGVDGILSVTPYYNKTTQKGLIEHFSTIASAIEIPVILYNVPSRTGMNIEPKTVEILSKVPNILGIKECNCKQAKEVKRLCGDNFAIYSGEDKQVVSLLSIGGKGVISVVANVMPKLTHDMVHSFWNGEKDNAERIQNYLDELIDALFSEVNPIPVKTAMGMMGFKVGYCKLPLTTMEEENYEKLRNVMIEYGLINK